MSTILNQWEKEAVRAGDPSDDLGMDVHWRERFLALIDLVRKKDEALAWYADMGRANWQNTIKAREALALTEELK